MKDFKLPLKGQTIAVLLISLVVLFAIYNYSTNKGSSVDGMSVGHASGVQRQVVRGSSSSAPMQRQPQQQMGTSNQAPDNYIQRQVVNPNDLLPTDTNSQWGDLNGLTPSNIATPDLLQAGYHIGLDTISQTLKNANYQLRSDPIIPKSNVGPWNNSTYEPDLGRVPLEIGEGLR